MSKRCKLQKEYYKKFGAYKGDGKYSDDYVKWLEDKLIELRSNDFGSSFYCQQDIEVEYMCDNQCDHCKVYYEPLEKQ